MEICNCNCKGGVANCDVIFQGGLNTYDEMWQGGGEIFAQNSVTSFMDGPMSMIDSIVLLWRSP